jgi:predicted Zn-dependent peptidase
LRQSDIDREKNVIIEEMNMYADNPARAVGQHFQQLCFLEQTLGHDIIGTKQTVSAMTTADFQRFLGEWYGQQNFVLVLAGDAGVVLRETLLKEIKQCFQKGDRTRGAAQPRKRLGAAPLTTHTLHVAEKKTEQAHFVLGFPAFSCFDDRRYALAVLANILGGNMSSRLFSEVREKRGLCYYVHSDVDLFYDTGIFGASAGVDPQRIEEAIRVTIAQFTQVIDGVQPITPQELSKAKENVAGRFALEFEESESVAQYYGMRYLVHGAVQTPEQTLEKYQAVTLEHVMTVAQELIQPKHLKLALIGPYSDTTPFEQLLSQ